MSISSNEAALLRSVCDKSAADLGFALSRADEREPVHAGRRWRNRMAKSRSRRAQVRDQVRAKHAPPSASSIGGKSRMALGSRTLTKLNGPAAEDVISQRGRPENKPFLLQVDRQTKSSFATYAAAEKAALVIKKNFPVVRVAIHDSITFVNKIIELAKT
jgi:hypothetical protein